MSTPFEEEHPQMPNHAAEHEPHLHPAAGPWQEGEPAETGYYLYVYEDSEGEHLDCAHFEKKEKTSWVSRLVARQIKVLRHAEVYRDHA